jgi:cytochrome c oxidase cbb3-type subunit 3/ubiquinol-cytochrome c reductase cytochrome c subunit
MRARFLPASLLTCALVLLAGCKDVPGKPKLGGEPDRPEHIVEFSTLYKQNCAACHGADGKSGPALALANPVYLASADEATLRRITAAGVKGTMMPPFGKASGGMLTDEQVAILAHGIAAWGNASALSGQTALPYAGATAGDPVHGQQVFTTSCASCHGADGAGNAHVGSIVDPAYLALISDQGLRSIVLGGKPALDGQAGHGMPSAYTLGAGGKPLSDQEITDTVAWLASHRTAAPGQPYQQKP